MAKKKFGSVVRVGDSWRASYRVPEQIVDRLEADGRHIDPQPSLMFYTEKNARDWLDYEGELMASGEWEQIAAREQVTFGEYAARWLDRKKPDGTPIAGSTRRKNRQMLERYLLPLWHDRPMASLTADDMDQWLRGFPGPNPSRYYCLVNILRPMFSRAVAGADNEGTPCMMHNIAWDVDAARPYPRYHESVAYEQIEALAQAMPGRLALAIYLGFLEGLRIGEILALRREDVDMEAGLIHVAETVITEDGEDGRERVSRGKTDVKTEEEGTRKAETEDEAEEESKSADVPILPALMPLLLTHLDAYTGPEPESLLFQGRSGLMRESTFNYHYRLARAKVPGLEGMRFHAARRNFIDLLEGTGAPLDVIRDVLRHSKAPAALDTYMNAVNEKRVHEAMRALGHATSRTKQQGADADADPLDALASWLESQPLPVRVTALGGMDMAQKIEVLSRMSLDVREETACAAFQPAEPAEPTESAGQPND